MSVVLFGFLAAFIVLAQFESVTRLMIAAGLFLLLGIALSGTLLWLICEAFDPHGFGSYMPAPLQRYTAMPKPAAFILSVAGALAAMGTGPMAGVSAAVGALAVVYEWNFNQNLDNYIRITHVLAYLLSFTLGYLLGTAMRLALDSAGAGATARILWGVAVGFLVIAIMHNAVYHVIEPAQKSYVCVFGL